MSLILAPYLRATEIVDFTDPTVAACARSLKRSTRTESAEAAFLFVRDDIRHSWDAQDRIVTCTASEALRELTGICYSKTHLLAALLRALEIPAGFDYQRLTLFDSAEDGHCIHALNTLYLRDTDRWIRLDARGNKPGIDAQFSLGNEQLAFPVRPKEGEIDYHLNLAEPHAEVVATLRSNRDCLDMYAHRLPTELAVATPR
jgi:transglutaminase-like putative cysteine protease